MSRATPMTFERRMGVYRRQNGRSALTPRQYRQADRMLDREIRRSAQDETRVDMLLSQQSVIQSRRDSRP